MLLNVEKFNEDLKICFDREVFQIFLPCGHSICCNKCAMGLQMCPICRENIKKTQTILQSRDSSILQSFKSSWNLKMFVVKWLKHSLGFLLFKSDLQRRMELFAEFMISLQNMPKSLAYLYYLGRAKKEYSIDQEDVR